MTNLYLHKTRSVMAFFGILLIFGVADFSADYFQKHISLAKKAQATETAKPVVIAQVTEATKLVDNSPKVEDYAIAACQRIYGSNYTDIYWSNSENDKSTLSDKTTLYKVVYCAKEGTVRDHKFLVGKTEWQIQIDVPANTKEN